jgi:sterol desaturase/sphingolipid hydroxylase (fatty acid hydroxylase superfamily)
VALTPRRSATAAEEFMGLITLKQSNLAYRLDFAFYGAAVATLGAILLIASPRADTLTNALCSLGALMSWSGIEYLLHRFVLHGLQPFRRWHTEHHRHPGALICSPTIFSASLILALVFLPSLGLVGPWHACSMTFGILVGYFSYAVTHHATHHWRAQSSWLRRRKQWHALHHHDAAQARCFGVSSSLWDHLLGTAPVRAASERAPVLESDLVGVAAAHAVRNSDETKSRG